MRKKMRRRKMRWRRSSRMTMTTIITRKEMKRSYRKGHFNFDMTPLPQELFK